jgi:NitT/TauT family transport system ATP-binding protein
MKQRVALVRAFLADPLNLLMDEPFGALDAQTRVILQQELLRIWRDNRKTVLFITHDIEEAIMLSDRILVMSDRPGRIQDDIRIDIARPRDITMRDSEIVKEIKWKIWKKLEKEVRKNLGVFI